MRRTGSFDDISEAQSAFDDGDRGAIGSKSQIDNRQGKLWVELDKSLAYLSDFHRIDIDEEVLQSIRNKMGNKKFCGLPPYSIPQTTAAMTYQSRKPLIEKVEQTANEYVSENGENGSLIPDLQKSLTPSSQLRKNKSTRELELEAPGAVMNFYAAQRKVSQALLTMVKNEAMVKYFLFKGGLDAVFKLIRESKLAAFSRLNSPLNIFNYRQRFRCSQELRSEFNSRK